MNQEEEIVFSFAKYKAAFKKYFYIVIICVVVAVAYICFGLISGNKNSEKDVKEEALTKIEPAAQGIYFKKSAYIAIDWSEMYPEPVLSEDASVSDREKATSIINDQINIEKNILNNSNAILGYREYKESVDNKLEEKGVAKLSDSDYIGYGMCSEKQITINVYTHSNVERTEALLDAAYIAFAEIAVRDFGFGQCIKTGDTYVYAATKNADGSYTDLGEKAEDYIKNKTNVSITTNDSDNATTVANGNDTISKKRVAIALCMAIMGFVIIGVIALMDKKVYITDEVKGMADVPLFGIVGDVAADDIFARRIVAKLESDGIESISIVSVDNIESDLDGVIGKINEAGVKAKTIVYVDNIEKIKKIGTVMIAVKAGTDTRGDVCEIVNNLKLDGVKVEGYIWVQ